MNVVTAILVVALMGIPVAGYAALLVPFLGGRPLQEAAVSRCVRGLTAVHLAIAVALLLLVVARGGAEIDLGQWYGDVEYALELLFRVDLTSAAAVTVSAAVGLVVLRFAENYLHREEGHLRFFSLGLLSLCCLDIIALAATLDLLFVGWELLGLCSFLLIAFFHERDATVERGLHAIFSYRIADLGLLLAVILLHGGHRAPTLSVPVPPQGALDTGVGLLLLLTAAGKAGLGPFSGWLSRCMEGPTPSTALFYAGLSVNAGPYLLLRSYPMYESSWTARAALVGFGLFAAVNATAHARTRTDVKGAIVIGGSAQVGLVVAEIGLGLHALAVVHLLGNTGLRTWQLLRAPNVLHLVHRREGLIGHEIASRRVVPVPLWLWAREGWFDAVIESGVRGVLALGAAVDSVSRLLESGIAGSEKEAPE